MKAEKKIISLEMPNELREKVRIEAFMHSRSISAEIRQILETYFADMNKNEVQIKNEW